MGFQRTNPSAGSGEVVSKFLDVMKGRARGGGGGGDEGASGRQQADIEPATTVEVDEGLEGGVEGEETVNAGEILRSALNLS
jgi:hypothetical protein